MYVRLYDQIEEGRAYLTVLYNIGLIILFSFVLGLLMCSLTDLLGFRYRETDSSDSDDEAGT